MKRQGSPTPPPPGPSAKTSRPSHTLGSAAETREPLEPPAIFARRKIELVNELREMFPATDIEYINFRWWIRPPHLAWVCVPEK